MMHTNESSTPAAAATGGTDRIYVPGSIVSADAVDADERTSAGEADLGALIRRERRRAAEARAEADAPLVDGTGARVCCVMCFNKRAEVQADAAEPSDAA